MTRNFQKEFKKKHASQKIIPDLSARIKEKITDNRITCSAAHEIADNTGLSPEKIGVQIDLLEYRISECQLGLFGYKEGKKLNPDIDITLELQQQIEKMTENKRISCKDCWALAEKLGMHRLLIGSACEKIAVRIKPCQLGAF